MAAEPAFTFIPLLEALKLANQYGGCNHASRKHCRRDVMRYLRRMRRREERRNVTYHELLRWSSREPMVTRRSRIAMQRSATAGGGMLLWPAGTPPFVRDERVAA